MVWVCRASMPNLFMYSTEVVVSDHSKMAS